MVSANPPSISFTSDFGGQSLTGIKTVSWTGADADGDALSYSLFYSPDGQLRIPLVTNTSATSYQWNTDDMPSGPSSLLTLMATDGVKATLLDSRPFTLPNRAPQIVILSPGNQQQFKPGEFVDLEGSFHDPEEGLELNPQLEWSSNIQGVLGTGKRIGLNNLSTGTHLITAAGADSQGARGSASITVIVRPDNFSNLAAAQTNLDFGSVAVGQTRDLTLSIQNSGNAPFTVSAITSNNARFGTTAPAAPFTIAARAQQEVNVRFTPVAAGDQAGTLTITANASNRSSLNVALAGKATGATARTVTTVSAASFSGQTLAAESIVAAFGASLATGVVVANTLPLPTSLAGTTVRVRDSLGIERLAPLFFVAPSQVNYLIPAGAATGAATITVTSGDGALSLGNVIIAAVAPGLFAANANGQGVPAAVALRVKANGAQSYEAVARFDAAQNRFVALPIDLGPPSDQVFLIMFGTGMRNVSSLAAAALTIGGTNTELLYVGAQGGFVGLDQVSARLPRSLIGRGEVDLVLTVDGQTANTVRVAFAGNQTCNYAIAPTSQSFNAGANTGSVNVTANSGCAWTAASSTGFITITSGATGNGNGTVNYSVAANTNTSPRNGTLSIAGQTFTVTQAGAPACSYAISPPAQSFAANGGTGSVSVTAPSGCAWTATSNANFITITGGASGTGNGTVNFTVAANTATSARSGTLTIAGQTFGVTQTGSGACAYTLTPANQVFTASGGSGSLNVVTQTGCNWTAATTQNWVVITAGKTGSGSGMVGFTVAANASTIPRAGAITVAGQTFLVGQTGTGATCRLLPISIGQTLNGELATTDCGSAVYGADYYADLFYFTASAGQRVALQLTSTAFDAYLTLIGPDGEVVEEDDDGGGGTDARIPASSGFLTLPLSGTYIIEASSAFKREIGVYKLSLSAPSGSVSGKRNGGGSRLP